MRSIALGLLACLAPISSCASPVGLLYSHTSEPLSTDFKETQVVSETAVGDVKRIDYYARIEWSANGIGEIAKENGFKEVHYADLETLKVLGIWTQQWVHVYGTR